MAKLVKLVGTLRQTKVYLIWFDNLRCLHHGSAQLFNKCLNPSKVLRKHDI